MKDAPLDVMRSTRPLLMQMRRGSSVYAVQNAMLQPQNAASARVQQK